MSNPTPETELQCSLTEACGAITRLIQPRIRDLEGFSVRRMLPVIGQKMIGPWVFFDHMGPAHFPAGQGINVRPHPHIGLATVTYLFEGEILHRDSLGSLQPIRPGDINLMVAGRGIVHSERERPEVTATDHTLHGLQLWLALPEADEDVEPAFHHYPDHTIPAITVADVPVRVLMGSAFGVSSPVRVFAETLYLEAWLKPGQTLTLPDATERGLYIASGKVKAAGTELPEYAMAVLSPDAGVTVEAIEPTRLALIGGAPVGKRFIDWNFVSSQQHRITQARDDWQARRFPLIPGDEADYSPLPS